MQGNDEVMVQLGAMPTVTLDSNTVSILSRDPSTYQGSVDNLIRMKASIAFRVQGERTEILSTERCPNRCRGLNCVRDGTVRDSGWTATDAG